MYINIPCTLIVYIFVNWYDFNSDKIKMINLLFIIMFDNTTPRDISFGSSYNNINDIPMS